MQARSLQPYRTYHMHSGGRKLQNDPKYSHLQRKPSQTHSRLPPLATSLNPGNDVTLRGRSSRSRTDSRQGVRRPTSNLAAPRAPSPSTNPAALPRTKPPAIAGTALSTPPFRCRAFSHEPPAEATHPRLQKEALTEPTTKRNWQTAHPAAASESGTSLPTVPDPMRSPEDGARAAPYLSYLQERVFLSCAVSPGTQSTRRERAATRKTRANSTLRTIRLYHAPKRAAPSVAYCTTLSQVSREEVAKRQTNDVFG